MMDSQENALNQGTEEVKLSEETVAKAPAEQNEVTDEDLNQPTETQSKCEAEANTAKTYSTKKEIIERLKAIVDSDETPEKAEVEHLKTVFYKLHFAEREAQQRTYIENGGDPEKYQVLPDEDEEVFKAEAEIFKGEDYSKLHTILADCRNLKDDGFAVIGTPNLTMVPYSSPWNKIAHINNYDQKRLYEAMSRYFENVFIFGMNDEVLHTGMYPMACYIMALGCGKKRRL